MTDGSKARIEVRDDGPIVITGATSMKGPDGEAVQTKPVMALCRCGGSKNKPFCDGSHNSNGFRSEGGEPAGRDRLISYEGQEVTVNFNPRICSHAAECARIAPKVFNSAERPWIQPDNGTVADVEAVVAACPSGALTLPGPTHKTVDRPEIEVSRDGPYWITGPQIEGDGAGEGATTEKYVLCRCGLSGSKPYCDGSHRDKGWTDGST